MSATTKSPVRIVWENDEICTIMLGDQEIVTVDHDAHGWDGMGAAIETATKLAERLGIDVIIEGVPNL